MCARLFHAVCQCAYVMCWSCLPACLCPCSWANHTNTIQLPRCRFTINKPFDFARFAAAAAGESSNNSSSSVIYKTLIIGPQTWTVTANTRDYFGVALTRTQLPLLHAWAITVHKSQVRSHAHTSAHPQGVPVGEFVSVCPSSGIS